MPPPPPKESDTRRHYRRQEDRELFNLRDHLRDREAAADRKLRWALGIATLGGLIASIIGFTVSQSDAAQRAIGYREESPAARIDMLERRYNDLEASVRQLQETNNALARVRCLDPLTPLQTLAYANMHCEKIVPDFATQRAEVVNTYNRSRGGN